MGTHDSSEMFNESIRQRLIYRTVVILLLIILIKPDSASINYNYRSSLNI